MPELLTEPDWTGQTEPDRLDYDEMRLDYPHPTGRGRHLHIARGGQHRGLILAGAAATDKTTAITQFGKPTRPSTADVTREWTTESRSSTSPCRPPPHPGWWPPSSPDFLGLPFTTRANITDIIEAVCVVAVDARVKRRVCR